MEAAERLAVHTHDAIAYGNEAAGVGWPARPQNSDAVDGVEAEAKVEPKWFVYERNPKDFARFSLGDTLAVTLGSYPVDTLYARATGTIENSLYMVTG